MMDHEDLAARVSDGHAIDWDEALGSASDDRERRIAGHLRLVEAVARVHRSASSDESGRPVSASVEQTRAPARGAARMPAVGMWAHLELREKLGEGAYGEVYRAWDPRLEREVALKLLVKGASRAVAEGRMLARLRHPNVVTVYGAEAHGDRAGIWMELIRGRTMSQLVREQGAFGAREAALVGIDLCRAVAAVHAAGVIHRDIKAENAMREEGGRILLTDFGAGIEAAISGDRGPRSISGTPLYMAPELFEGEPATQRSDIYSLGVLLYKLVTGSHPVEASTWDALRDKHRGRQAVLLRDRRPDLPGGFVAVVERATSWSPPDRFATAGAMEQALASMLGEAKATPVVTAGSGGRRGLTWIVAGVAATALLAAGLVVAPRFLKSPDPAAEPPAPQAAAASPAASSYTVEAALYREPEGSDAAVRLEPGARLQLGDRLRLEFKASAPLHVYVIDEDEEGHAYALFPLPGLQPQNPLPAGATHVLPGSRGGERQSWTVDSYGGREHLMVLASPERLVDFEAEMNALARAGESAVAIPETAKVRLRGIGGLSASQGSRPAASAGRLFEMGQQLAGRSEVTHGVWMRSIELENPRR